MNLKDKISQIIQNPVTLGISFFTILIIIIVGLWIKSSLINTAKIDISVLPQDAIITMNDKVVKNGRHNVTPGNYVVKASKEGMISFEESFEVKKGETKYVYSALTYNDGSLFESSSSEDDMLLTKMGDLEYIEISQNVTEKYPILNHIPYTNYSHGYGIRYKIDVQYGTRGEIQYIPVQINTCSQEVYDTYKQEVLDLLESKEGVVLDDYTFRFTALCEDIVL